MAAWRRSARDPSAARTAADAVLAGRFTFLGETRELGPEPDWLHPDLDVGTRLWKTHLHEFGFAEELARAAAESGEPRYRERLFALARSWRAACPIGCRDFALDAWNARAVARRLQHWAVAGALLGLRPGDPEADRLGREIGLHGLFLRDNLELDLRGNHLWSDAVGLVFADALCGAAPDALALLERQVAEQVLPDGCHAERAPFYHAVCTRELLEVALLLGPETPRWLGDALARMAGLLEAWLLGDGEIPLLGDGWLGDVDTPRLLAAVGQVVAPRPPRAPERHGGIVPLAGGPWRVVVRAGRHAPDEQMGHAHADLLSFDASLGCHRVVSDTGTLCYDPGPERDRLRATAAHNTLRLDGAELLEAWGSFRAGRRGRARAHCRGAWGTWQWLSASHDAYEWLPGRPIHHRLLAVGERGLLVLDALLGTGPHRIESHVHEHPDSPGLAFVALAGESVCEPAPLHERFGETREMRRHRVALEAVLPWVGGWWIGPEASAERVAGLERVGDRVRLQLAAPALLLQWRPELAAAREAVVFGADRPVLFGAGRPVLFGADPVGSAT